MQRPGPRAGRRKLLPISQIPLVGGEVCLDLTNTTGARASERPRERLHSYDDLLTWSRRAGILTGADVARLRRMAGRRAPEAADVVRRASLMREQLYSLFRAVAEERKPPTTALQRLSGWWRAERRRRELVRAGGRFELRLRVRSDELDAMLWPVVASAVDLLTSERIARIKRCAECDWLFVDESKNGSRTWCKRQCGDRTRARRYYERRRQQRST